MEKNNKTWYTGIADSKGVESFLPLNGMDPQEYNLLHLRAASNPHRFAVVYKAELDDQTADNVTTHLEEGNYINALKAMSNGIKDNNLEAEATNRKYWNLITKHSATLNRILKEQE